MHLEGVIKGGAGGGKKYAKMSMIVTEIRNKLF